MSKPGKVLKGLCKKLGVRLTVKRGKKRVYKSVKVLKRQCANKKKKKKKVKRKVKRKRRFGSSSSKKTNYTLKQIREAKNKAEDAWREGFIDDPQKKLQEEIEKILGSPRIPALSYAQQQLMQKADEQRRIDAVTKRLEIKRKSKGPSTTTTTTRTQPRIVLIDHELAKQIQQEENINRRGLRKRSPINYRAMTPTQQLKYVLELSKQEELDKAQKSAGKRKRKQNTNTKQKRRKQNIHWDKTVKNWPRTGDDYQASIPMYQIGIPPRSDVYEHPRMKELEAQLVIGSRARKKRKSNPTQRLDSRDLLLEQIRRQEQDQRLLKQIQPVDSNVDVEPSFYGFDIEAAQDPKYLKKFGKLKRKRKKVKRKRKKVKRKRKKVKRKRKKVKRKRKK